MAAPEKSRALVAHSDYKSNSDYKSCQITRARQSSASVMPSRYPQYCPVARSLDIIGERWTLLVLRDLFLHGPRKFHDFERSFGAISPNTLSARLKRLEDAGLIARRFYAEHPPRAEYVLTNKGEALRPTLKALREWGERYVPRAGKG